MMKGLYLSLTIFVLANMSGCNFMENFEQRAAVVNRYERTALQLAKENRELKAHVGRLQFEIQGLKSKNNYLQIRLDEKNRKKRLAQERALASKKIVQAENDLVRYDTYKWRPNQLLAMAEREFEQKNFEKSAQFFQTYLVNFGQSKQVTDQLLFQAGMAAFESGQHYDWAVQNLEKLIRDHPNSSYFRAAKLWLALTNLQLGNKKFFFKTVEEFRMKYRNTSEWEILSAHYERILQKYKH